MSLSFIAETIGGSVGTVSREIRRNSNSKGVVSLIKASGLRTRTITTDDGTEFAAHEAIARELKTIVYFAHPYSPWEKGAMENANGLVRQYIPK
ncbi:MAG: IS30 family transposase [Prevotella sp.]|nr:IS30 family transposase [Prevotella sp.]